MDTLLGIVKRDGSGLHAARGAAALAIGMVGDGTTVKKLVDFIQETPRNEERAFAIAALGCLIDRAPVSRISELFKNVHDRVDHRVVTEVMSIL